VQFDPVIVAALVKVIVFVPRVNEITGATVPLPTGVIVTHGLPEFCPCWVGVDTVGMFMLWVIRAVVSASEKLTVATTRDNVSIWAAVGATDVGLI
jgi:hypothetical protein